jgi:DNA-binding response OmpR family regulator
MAVGPWLDKAADGRRVVLIDDDETVRELCAEALVDAGYRVHAFAAGEEALDALAALGVEVLVVDWNLPGLDGVEVTRRALALIPDLPVLMISGNRRDAEDAAVGSGVCRVIGKPFLIEELVAAVSALV